MKKKIKKKIKYFFSFHHQMESLNLRLLLEMQIALTDTVLGLEAGRNAWTHIILKEIPTGFKDKQICCLVVKLLTCGWK